jgi:hypothetical protein
MKGEKRRKRRIKIKSSSSLHREKILSEHERMSKQGKLLMLLLNDGQINSKV